LNDLICRRYSGAFAGPTDERLLQMPWVVKEAIWVLDVQEELAAWGLELAPTGDVLEFVQRAREAVRRASSRR